jgi:CRISPR-associated protein Cas2
MYVLVYDVVNDRRRNRLHRSLKNFGTAVQRSVFEFDLAPRDAHKMMERVERIIDLEEDVVRMSATVVYTWSASSAKESRV